ncbi:3-hydroxybutyryl-CoA dehydrogenase [Fertoebacter nigrum]|uniref:3-hydroxybutyryl-CoA dehydrogenase n=2 Tax=Fertoeibacter niger TaxID=2656921 RepID=A0A8X8KQY3_9RHOB|nr:3-hydroxybutyryl-CoA dehydrogenase [Fertoeibacter niger]
MAVIGVVGLGVMGLGIAQVYAAAGNRVIVTDADSAVRDAALGRVRDACALRVAAGKMQPAAMAAMLRSITLADAVAGLAGTDLVIEAVVEKLAVKQALFRQVEAVSGAVLATNTSSLSVAAMADALARPDRVLGLHFFNPAPVMKLVELVGLPGTAPEALALARSVTEAAGKTVVACADRPGFIVNRCARPYYGEALALLEEGRSPGEIDAAMTGAGYRLGPFALIDLIGADINLAATEGLLAGMAGHPRYHVFQALRDQVARGDLGRKTGRGFVQGGAPQAVPADADALALRIEAALVNEACWLLAEGGVDREGIDTALRLGLNFPRGPFEMLAAHGAPAVMATLATLETRAPAHLKGRYLPAPNLKDQT